MKNIVDKVKALEFEFYSINYHINKYGHKVWHQSVIPEDELYKAGFIHNFNRTRLNRLALLREENGNSVKYGDYGMDFLALDEETGLYHAGQSKCYLCNKVSSNDLGTFYEVLVRIPNTGYLYTTNKITINLYETIQLKQNKWIIHNQLSDFNGEVKTINNINEIQYELRPYQKEAIQAILGGKKR